MLTFRWKCKKLEQIDVIEGVVELLGHFYSTRSQDFACAKMASSPKTVVEVLTKSTVVITLNMVMWSQF